MEYKVLKTDGKAKRAEMKTVHGRYRLLYL